MTQEELAAVLADHELWVNEKGGKRANLYGAKLDFADLTGANLSGANLSATNLHRANLSGADLGGVELCGANLYGADLRRSNLDSAIFYDANLTRTKLAGANLREAKFEGARIEADRKVIQLLRHATRSDGEELFLWHCHELPCHEGFYVKSGQLVLSIREALIFWEETNGANPLEDEMIDILDMFQKAIKRVTITPQSSRIADGT
jgi:hypothetical protein